MNGFRYFAFFLGDVSRYSHLVFLQKKCDIYRGFSDRIENGSIAISTIRTDWGVDVFEQNFPVFCVYNDIRQQFSLLPLLKKWAWLNASIALFWKLFNPCFCNQHCLLLFGHWPWSKPTFSTFVVLNLLLSTKYLSPIDTGWKKTIKGWFHWHVMSISTFIRKEKGGWKILLSLDWCFATVKTLLNSLYLNLILPKLFWKFQLPHSFRKDFPGFLTIFLRDLLSREKDWFLMTRPRTIFPIFRKSLVKVLSPIWRFFPKLRMWD